MSVENARKELRDLQQRRDRNEKAKSAKQTERRDLMEKLRHKERRDPKDQARANDLDEEIRRLHGEARELRKRIRELTDRHKELSDAIDAQERKLEAAVKRRRERREGGPDKAVKWAHGQVGVHESPAGSNWGHPVQDWIQRAGYTYPVPWCGCFAHEAVVEQGGANVYTQLGYAGNIIADARANRNGLRLVSASEAKAGDVASLWGAEHVVVLRGKISGSTFPTVEGNTSAANGSQTNGGEVAEKVRSVNDVDVFARPAY